MNYGLSFSLPKCFASKNLVRGSFSLIQALRNFYIRWRENFPTTVVTGTALFFHSVLIVRLSSETWNGKANDGLTLQSACTHFVSVKLKKIGLKKLEAVCAPSVSHPIAEKLNLVVVFDRGLLIRNIHVLYSVNNNILTSARVFVSVNTGSKTTNWSTNGVINCTNNELNRAIRVPVYYNSGGQWRRSGRVVDTIRWLATR